MNLELAENFYKDAYNLTVEYIEKYDLTLKGNQMGRYCGTSNFDEEQCKANAKNKVTSIDNYDPSSDTNYASTLSIAVQYTYVYLYIYLPSYGVGPTDISTSSQNDDFVLTLYNSQQSTERYVMYVALGTYEHYSALQDHVSNAASYFAKLDGKADNFKKNAYYIVASLADYIDRDDFSTTLYNGIYLVDGVVAPASFSKDKYVDLFNE